MTKDVVVQLRLSAEEKARLERHAASAGLGVSEFLRRAIPGGLAEAGTVREPKASYPVLRADGSPSEARMPVSANSVWKKTCKPDFK